MEQIFNFKRFGNLLWRSLVQYKYVYLRVSLICLSTFIILGCFSFIVDSGVMFFYTMMINLLITISPAVFFFKKRSHTSHIYEFTLPASITEKFLVKLLGCILIFPALIITLSFLFIYVAKVMPADFIRNAAEYSYTSLMNVTISQYWNIIAVQSIFLCGSYFFKDIAFLKTILIMMGISIIVLIMFFTGIASVIKLSVDSYNLEVENASDLFESSKSYFRNILYIIQYCVPVGLWFASFYKLKETEI